MNSYHQTLDYLYSMLPMFHRIGPAAYKKDLTNTIALCEALDNPQEKYRIIHIAGTNGKGSVSHMLASVLQSAGYRTGLYTSPHLLDFRERIKVDGEMITEEEVVQFVNRHRDLIETVQPSFFELTVAMAFHWFAFQQVDFAVIETGLGGRLDSTNIVRPVASVITNISLDHQNMLGNSLPEIAAEKAGIIKGGIPVVVGKWQNETHLVFEQKARALNADLYFADKLIAITDSQLKDGFSCISLKSSEAEKPIILETPLCGEYQAENIRTLLQVVEVLRSEGIRLPDVALKRGVKEVLKHTGLRGRWEILSHKPLIICDVAHNEAGLQTVLKQASNTPHKKLRIVYGMVRDKNVEKALDLLPEDAFYYFCQPDLPRSLDVKTLYDTATSKDLKGKAYPSVAAAIESALEDASDADLILITGSFFVVAEVLAYFSPIS